MLTRRFIALLVAAMIAPLSLGQAELDGDFDSDGIIDRFDNCHVYPNPLQGDADADGWGNRCDADLNNDGVHSFGDLAVFSDLIFTSGGPADFNEDGIVNFFDLSVFRQLFAQDRPGPAIVMRWVGGSGSWHDRSNWLPPQVPSVTFESAIINTPNDVVVTVEAGRVAGARNLELDGNLSVCGRYSSSESTFVNGTLSIDCSAGYIFSTGIELAGQVILNAGRFNVRNVRQTGDAQSEIIVDGSAEIDSGSQPFTTDLDISVRPGANLLLTGPELFLDEASLRVQSDVNLPGSVVMGNGIFAGSGSIEFEGPTDASAVGVIQSFAFVDIGSDIEINIQPNAYAFVDSQIRNSGRINVSDSATLFFPKFNLTTNSGEITCSSNGRLAEFETGLPSPGDSILLNNSSGELAVDNCTMTWPTRALNSGIYQVSASEITLPAIAASNFPLDITGTDISIEPFQPPVPDNFYIFDPQNNNSFVLRGLLDLGTQTLEIDASKWRFGTSPQSSGVNVSSGTLVSETPLNVNAGIDVFFQAVVFETDITLDPGASMITNQIVGLNKDIRFLSPEDCASAPSDPAVLRMNFQPLPSSSGSIRVESTASPDEENCLQAEIVTEGLISVPSGIDIDVSNAELKLYAEQSGRFTIEGDTTVSGPDSILTLEQTTIANLLSCSNGASVFASGTAQQPFISSTLLTSNNCNIHFSGDWQNDGEVFATLGTLSLIGPENTQFTPGSGTFFTDRTDVFFDLDIGDPSTLEAFKVIPPGGSFTFAGTVTNPGPELDLSSFPFNTAFGDGFELADTRITGFQTFALSGSTTLRNVELAVTTVVSGDSTLNVYEQFSLDDATLLIQAGSLDGAPSTTQVLLHGVPGISGAGELLLQPVGENAVSQVLQTVDNTSLSIDANIATRCVSGGLCTFKAGSGSGQIDFFGELVVSDEGSRLGLESDTSIYKTASLLNHGQIRLADATALTFSGPESGLEIELLNEPMQPGLVAEGAATIDITAASLSFVAGNAFVLESGEAVTVLSHEGGALRIGEFADISEAAIDGFLFSPDYSSPDVTVFRGPDLGTPAASN
ncbi:MAG: hypothetical protein AB8G18_06105 [Gammaproteobacteria bacterium]